MLKEKPVNKTNPAAHVTPAEYGRVYIETFGCQMNVSDSQVAVSVLKKKGLEVTDNIGEADVILVNTCSIRENAEKRVWGRLQVFAGEKKRRPGVIVGVIGCMAERLKSQLLDNSATVDIVAGPDAYRKLPELIEEASSGQQAINVLLSREETYADIEPVRSGKNNVTAFVSIMRGCNNFCSYCVVPFTRGRERSRAPSTILGEVRTLIENGYKEVTLLGQNVNSYRWTDSQGDEVMDFPELIEKVALLSPDLRVRFSTSHPKDISDKLLYTIAAHKNICKHIHLPVQSGSSRILKLMNRAYTRESYMERINAVKTIIPGCTVTTDIIAGFCSETEKDHQQTISLIKEAGFDFAFMFKYSERPGTPAGDKLTDDVAEEVKTRRLNEIIELQNSLSAESKKNDLGKVYKVLAESFSKKSENELFGRTSHNKSAVFPKQNYQPGDYVNVKITGHTSATLIGCPEKTLSPVL